MGKLATIPAYKASKDTYLDKESGTFKLKPGALSRTIHEGAKKAEKKANKMLAEMDRKHVPRAPMLATCNPNHKTKKKAEFLAGVCPVPRKGAYHGSTMGTAGVHKSKAPKPQKPQPSLTGFNKLVRGKIVFISIEVPKVKTQQDVLNLIKSGKIGPTTEVDFVNKKGKIERRTALKAMDVLPFE